jgi:hypothetical protein
METIKIKIPEGFEQVDQEKTQGWSLDDDGSAVYHIVFKKNKPKLPKTWDDVKHISGYYVGDICNVECEKGEPNSTNKNVFCTYEQAKASIALAQLSQFRQIYRQGWKPDWNDNKSTKWCVIFHRDKVIVDVWYNGHQFLAFQSKEIAQEFLDHFGVLILQAKSLMS